MIRLITLEIKRCRLTTYHRAASIGGITMLGFLYFMAAIPWIDPTDTDIELFASYDFLFNLEHLLSMAIFSIMGAVMGARFVVEEYAGERAVLLFSYPIRREMILGAKLCLVFFYTLFAMLVWSAATEIIFFVTESLFPIGSGTFSWDMVLWIFLSLLCHSLIAGAVAIISLWIGFLKKSVSSTIVASVITATLLCQILSAVFAFRQALFILSVVLAAAAIAAVKHLFYQIGKMEV